MKMANLNDINEARKLLGLNQYVTLREINHAYKHLSYQYHPDVNGVKSEDMMKKLNQAYKLLMDYINDYVYSFKEADIARAYPLDEYMRKHYDFSDWM
jgi:DnaJ-class molecular chaperone